MKSKHFLLEFAALVLCLSISITHGAAEEKTCAQIIAELGKKQISGVGACTKELNFKSPKEKKEKMNCVMKCVMKKEHILGADGKFDMVSINKLIDENMPPSLSHLRAKGEAMFNGCKDTHEPNLNDAEENCKTYAPLIKCLMGMMNLCKD